MSVNASFDYSSMAQRGLYEMSTFEMLKMAQTCQWKTAMAYKQKGRGREIPFLREFQATRFIAKLNISLEEEQRMWRKRNRQEELAPEPKRQRLEEVEEEKIDIVIAAPIAPLVANQPINMDLNLVLENPVQPYNIDLDSFDILAPYQQFMNDAKDFEQFAQFETLDDEIFDESDQYAMKPLEDNDEIFKGLDFLFE